MNINERQRLLKKIIADLEYLIKESWHTDIKEDLGKAIKILEENSSLEGYDD